MWLQTEHMENDVKSNGAILHALYGLAKYERMQRGAETTYCEVEPK